MAKKKRLVSKHSGDNILVEHGEKLVFGLACVLIGVFIWMGVKTPSYDKTTPTKLHETASVTAKNHINNPKSWDSLGATREADTFAPERIENNTGMLNPASYPFGPISGAIIETLAKRVDPIFLAPKDFEVNFIRTQIATKAPEKEGTTEGKMQIALNALPTASGSGLSGGMKFWMFAYRPQKHGMTSNSHLAMTYDVVNGIALIPFEEQRANYREKFRYSEGWHSVRDQPIYRYLQIQRSEDGGQTWRDINKEIDNYTTQHFGEPAKEVIDEDYLIEKITRPIPPLLSFDYREVAGHSEVPFARLAEDKNKDVKKEVKDTGSMFDPKEKIEVDVADDEEDKRAKYRLARFFDPTPKEIGKTYQYRIRGWIIDPNSLDLAKALGVEEDKPKNDGGPGEIAGPGGGTEGPGGMDDTGGSGRGGGGDKGDKKKLVDEGPPVTIVETMLAKSVRDRQKKVRDDIPEDNKDFLSDMIPTPWSEVSEVTIPLNYARFYTGPVKAASRVKSAEGISYMNEEYEDTAAMVAISSTPNLDVSIPVTENRVYRGAMLNFNSVAKFLHPITWQVKELHEYVGTEVDTSDKRLKINGKFFQTDAIVLDLMGGERMPFSNSNSGTFTMPSELIVMDSTGRLIVRDELEDATNFRINTFAGDDPEPDQEAKDREAAKNKKKDDGPGDVDF